MHAPGFSGICAYIRIFSSIGGGGTDINLDQIFSSIGGTLRDVCGWRGIYKKVRWMFCMKESICLQPSRRSGIDGGGK